MVNDCSHDSDIKKDDCITEGHYWEQGKIKTPV